MEAHHLLWAYLAVWLIQGGYCVWIAWQWMHTPDCSGMESTDSRPIHEDS
jgi:hypothetical protein